MKEKKHKRNGKKAEYGLSDCKETGRERFMNKKEGNCT
jgi:hypothetical protein